jgi:hypothetical protein
MRDCELHLGTSNNEGLRATLGNIQQCGVGERTASYTWEHPTMRDCELHLGTSNNEGLRATLGNIQQCGVGEGTASYTWVPVIMLRNGTRVIHAQMLCLTE